MSFLNIQSCAFVQQRTPLPSSDEAQGAQFRRVPVGYTLHVFLMIGGVAHLSCQSLCVETRFRGTTGPERLGYHPVCGRNLYG